MAVRETHNDTLGQRHDREQDGQLELTLPDDIDTNALSRRVFGGRPGDTGLELLDAGSGTVLYLLPWAGSGGRLAGYRQDLDTYNVTPVELPPERVRELFKNHIARETALVNTPAWLLSERASGRARVSWHARVRYSQRVEPMADPAPAIRSAYERAGHVGADGFDRVVYDPETEILLAIQPNHAVHDVATVLPASEVEYTMQHWRGCETCGQEFDPSRHQGCPYHE